MFVTNMKSDRFSNYVTVTGDQVCANKCFTYIYIYIYLLHTGLTACKYIVTT